MIRGLDVSQVQGAVDWPKVAAAGFTFVIVKTTEGLWQDPKAIANLNGARAAGLYVGVYSFARISMGDPEPQVDALWKDSGDVMPDLPPTLDLENAPDGKLSQDIIAWAERWAKHCSDTFGRWPLIYTYPDFERRRLAAFAATSRILGACSLWMADYSGGEAPPAGWHPFTPAPWSKWTLAQTSGNNSSLVPGIPWHVDHNVFNGDETDFARFRGIPDAPPTEPDPSPLAA